MHIEIALAGRVTVRSAHAGRAVPLDELAEALWGDRLPRSYRTAVRMAASRLRWALTAGR